MEAFNLKTESDEYVIMPRKEAVLCKATYLNFFTLLLEQLGLQDLSAGALLAPFLIFVEEVAIFWRQGI